MKKALISLLLIMLAIVPVFAEDNFNTPKELKVFTTVGEKNSIGILKVSPAGTTNPDQIPDITFDNFDTYSFITDKQGIATSSNLDVNPFGTNFFWVAIKTNSASQIKATVTHTNLYKDGDTNKEKISVKMSTLYISEGVATEGQSLTVFNQQQDYCYGKTSLGGSTTNNTEIKGRVHFGRFSLTFDSSTATAGTYEGTVTITVSNV